MSEADVDPGLPDSDGLFPSPTLAVPVTGDQAVDDALGALSEAFSGDLDQQVAAGQRFEEVLQARLSDLGAE